MASLQALRRYGRSHQAIGNNPYDGARQDRCVAAANAGYFHCSGRRRDPFGRGARQYSAGYASKATGVSAVPAFRTLARNGRPFTAIMRSPSAKSGEHAVECRVIINVEVSIWCDFFLAAGRACCMVQRRLDRGSPAIPKNLTLPRGR